MIVAELMAGLRATKAGREANTVRRGDDPWPVARRETISGMRAAFKLVGGQKDVSGVARERWKEDRKQFLARQYDVFEREPLPRLHGPLYTALSRASESARCQNRRPARVGYVRKRSFQPSEWHRSLGKG